MENIIIEKTGVVYYYYGYETSFRVDSFDLLSELSKKLEASGPSTDYDGRFAGRVKIEIEFLGEQLEEESEDEQ